MIKLLPFILLVSISTCHLANAKPDAEMPVQISADHVNFDQNTGTATYFGHVIVTQGSRNLQANKLVIMRDAKNRIKLMTATGNPAVFSAHENKNKPQGSGKARIIKYYPQADKVDLIDNASLTQNGDTVSGPKLTYNLATAELAGKSSEQQRTTVVLQPKRVP